MRVMTDDEYSVFCDCQVHFQDIDADIQCVLESREGVFGETSSRAAVAVNFDRVSRDAA